MTNGTAFLSLCFSQYLTFHPSPRDNIQPLIHRVHRGRQKSFPTHQLAQEYYLGAKRLNQVWFVRNPGDDEVYGPRDQAVQ